MTKLIFIFIISAAIITVQGDDNNPTNANAIPPEPPHNGTTPTPPTTSSTPPPTTKPPTLPPTTKPPTPAPTTKPPTPAPTTKPPTPPTTKPPTPPTTTKPPAPLPPKPVEPSEGNWEFNYTTNPNEICMKMHFAIQIVVPYLHKAKNMSCNATVNIPPSAQVSGGNCVSGKDTEDIEIQWMNDDKATDNIKFQFIQNLATKDYQLKGINLNITPDDVSFPGIEDKNTIILNNQSTVFNISLLKSYKCDKEQILNLVDVSNKGRGSIHISHLQMQAFGGNTTSKEFYNAIDCDSSNTPDVVPIAVGCALAILVIVVLVAYLIGRKRRQARGYLSMFTETKRESDYIPMKNLSCFQ